MDRLIVTALFAFGILAMSCQVEPGSAPRASVDAPHAANHDTLATPTASAVAVEKVTTPTHSPEMQRALDLLHSRHTGLTDAEIGRLAATIVEEAARHGLELDLVLGVIHVESGGYAFATSPVGAMGLMQLMPSTGAELAARHGVEWRGKSSLFNPEVNVKLGTAYLKQLADKYGNMPTALAAYNWGPGRIDGFIRRGAGLPRIYVDRVMEAVASSDSVGS